MTSPHFNFTILDKKVQIRLEHFKKLSRVETKYEGEVESRNYLESRNQIHSIRKKWLFFLPRWISLMFDGFWAAGSLSSSIPRKVSLTFPVILMYPTYNLESIKVWNLHQLFIYEKRQVRTFQKQLIQLIGVLNAPSRLCHWLLQNIFHLLPFYRSKCQEKNGCFATF